MNQGALLPLSPYGAHEKLNHDFFGIGSRLRQASRIWLKKLGATSNH